MTRASDPTTATPLVVLAAATTVTLWASSFVVIRAVGTSYEAGSMALLRMVVGTLALTLIAARSGFRPPPRSQVPLLIAWGAGWFCVYNLALNTAEQTIDAGTTAMVVNLAPLIVVALAASSSARASPTVWSWALRSPSSGCWSSASPPPTPTSSSRGCCSPCWPPWSTRPRRSCQKHLLHRVDSATLTWLGALTGTIALLPWAAQLVQDMATAPLGATLAVVYMGVFPTAIAFTTWAFVLSRSSAGSTSATTYVVPALALLMSWALLDETPTAVMLAGGVLCLLGVLVVRWPARRTTPAVETPGPVPQPERC